MKPAGALGLEEAEPPQVRVTVRGGLRCQAAARSHDVKGNEEPLWVFNQRSETMQVVF